MEASRISSVIFVAPFIWIIRKNNPVPGGCLEVGFGSNPTVDARHIFVFPKAAFA